MLACVFAKPSLRTRVSFEVAMRQLGGETLFITDKEIGLGTRESVHDVAKVMSRFVRRHHDPLVRPRRGGASWPATPPCR